MSKQLKISDLRRVVNVDTITKHAAYLKSATAAATTTVAAADVKQIERIIDELNQKMPSREILMRTRLGFILKDVSERATLPKTVRDKARLLRAKWKEFHKRLLLAPKYDVKCDKPTTEHRQKARAALTSAFVRSNQATTSAQTSAQSSNASTTAATTTGTTTSTMAFSCDLEEHVMLINDLEFAIYQHCDTLVNSRYFATVKCCAKRIGESAWLRDQFLGFEVNCATLLLRCLSSSTDGDSSNGAGAVKDECK